MNPHHYTLSQIQHSGRTTRPEDAYTRAVELGIIGQGDQPIAEGYPESVTIRFGLRCDPEVAPWIHELRQLREENGALSAGLDRALGFLAEARAQLEACGITS